MSSSSSSLSFSSASFSSASSSFSGAGAGAATFAPFFPSSSILLFLAGGTIASSSLSSSDAPPIVSGSTCLVLDTVVFFTDFLGFSVFFAGAGVGGGARGASDFFHETVFSGFDFLDVGSEVGSAAGADGVGFSAGAAALRFREDFAGAVEGAFSVEAFLGFDAGEEGFADVGLGIV